MNVKELKSKVRELRNEAASLETVFDKAVIKYLKTVVGVASRNSYVTYGKACLEKICANYDSDDDLVKIDYFIMNEHGDFIEFKTILVSSSKIDKYILI